MFSLRSFHAVFVLAALVITDMFGAWAIYQHAQSPDIGLLVAGTLSFAAGFAIVVYAIWYARKVENAHL